MRISGGTAKGRRTAGKRILAATSTAERLRPTSAKVREALFDILRNRIPGAVFLDLYAGTGTVGFEALSRGADKVVFVETDLVRVRAIQGIARELGFLDKSVINKCPASDFLRKAADQKAVFDIIFADPPYRSEDLTTVFPIIAGGGLLTDEGALIAEHYFKLQVPDAEGSLRKQKTYRYGDTLLTLYGKSEAGKE